MVRNKLTISIAIWLFDNVKLGKLVPWVFGFIIGKMPHKGREEEDD